MGQTVRIILTVLLHILPFIVCWVASRGRPSRYALLAALVIAVLTPSLALWAVRTNADSRDRDVLVNS